MGIVELWNWFSGGTDQYSTLVHCMNHDWAWIGFTVALDLAVAAGYAMIALHWWANQRALPESPAKTALSRMRNIFVFCGLCGYLFIPIKMFWPAWRLYDLFLLALVYFTWTYAWNARDLKVIYSELGRNKQLARDLEASRAEARQKSFFLNSLSHDLRTPLNSLNLNVQLAEMQLEDDVEALRQTLAEVRASAKAAADLLDSFLELGRLDWSADQPRPGAFALADCLARLVASSRALAEQKGLDLRLGDVPAVELYTDRLKLERILQNLIDNALKFTRTGWVRVDARASGGSLTIGVHDSGEGIAPEHQDRLFDEFFQVHNSERDRTKGFGLGLSIARRLARQLGGDLRVESEPGRGSRFTLVLPRALADGRGHPEPGADRGAPSGVGPPAAAAPGRG